MHFQKKGVIDTILMGAISWCVIFLAKLGEGAFFRAGKGEEKQVSEFHLDNTQ